MQLNKSQKFVKMLEIMARRGGVSAGELMERLDVDARTLRRYLADLKGMDIPVHDEGRSADRVISIDPSYRRTGVQLTLAEVLSLHFGRTLFNFLEGTSFAEDLTGALERLEPAISRAHADLARQLDTKFLAVPEHAKDYRGDASEIIDEVISALVYNNVIDARYRKPSGVEATYRLHPFTLATFRQGLYLFALDVEAAQVKTFAMERFTDLVRLREHFAYPANWHPQARIADAFGIISGPPEDVQIAFTEKVAAYIRERTWHPSQTLRTLEDGRLLLRLRVAVTVELEQWVLGFGPDAEVMSPEPFVARIGDALRRAAARYGGTA